MSADNPKPCVLLTLKRTTHMRTGTAQTVITISDSGVSMLVDGTEVMRVESAGIHSIHIQRFGIDYAIDVTGTQ